MTGPVAEPRATAFARAAQAVGERISPRVRASGRVELDRQGRARRVSSQVGVAGGDPPWADGCGGRSVGRPFHEAEMPGGQHDDAEGDAIPGEGHEVVAGDVAQQPAHAQEGGDEGRDEADDPHAQVVGAEKGALLGPDTPWRRPGGMARKNENSVAALRDRPNSMPPMIVEPERECRGSARRPGRCPS